MKKVFIGLFLALLPLSFFAQSKVPLWAEKCGDNGLWLGVSPQIYNKEEARLFAITNAMLSYVFTTGNADFSATTTNSSTSLNAGEKCSSKKDYAEKSLVELKNVSVDVVQESYNNGEYYVACKIVSDNSSSTSLKFSRYIITNSESENSGWSHKNNFVSKYLLRIGLHLFEITFASNGNYDELEFKSGGENTVISYSEGTPALKYRQALFGESTRGNCKSYITQLKNSLGYTQFREFNFLPLLAPDIRVLSRVTSIRSDDKKENNMLAVYKSEGKLLPVKLYMDNLDGGELEYVVPSAGVNGKNVQVYDGFQQEFDAPLWVAKSRSFYNVLNDIALDITKNIPPEDLVEYYTADGKIDVEKMYQKVSGYTIDWRPDVSNKMGTAASGELLYEPFIRVYCDLSKAIKPSTKK